MRKAHILLVTLFLYVLLQFTWWAYLIYVQTISLGDSKQKAFWMVFGEGIIFIIILIFGFVLILRYFHSIQKQQKIQEDFLLSFTHELKTPITGARLALQTLGKEIPKEKKEKIIENGVIQTQRIATLVDNVLNASRIHSGGYNVHEDSIDVIQLIKQHKAHLKSIYTTTLNIDHKTPTLTLKTDRYALSSILMNLIENACKYSLKNTEVKINIVQEKQQLILEVCNKTTTDFFKKNEKEIFEKFKGGKGSSTQNSTGLGLYISKEFAKLIKATLCYTHTEENLIMKLILPLK